MLEEVQSLCEYINMTPIPSSWLNCYEKVKRNYKEDWLNTFDFNDFLSFYEFSSEYKERFFLELESLKNDKKLNFICYIMYYIVYYAKDPDYYNIWSWGYQANLFKNNGSFMLPVVALLAGTDKHKEVMEKRKYDTYQIAMQKYNVRYSLTIDKIEHNLDGIRFSKMIWSSLFIKGNLIQIGRLQYEVGVKNFSKLAKYFNEDSSYIYIHIPVEGDFTKESIHNSLIQAPSVINTYFPEYKNSNLVFYTQTWLLSPEVKEILPATSNIRAFQELFEIIECEENIGDFLNFVFKTIGEVEYENLKEDTIIQRKLKQKILNKEKLHLGLGIIKPDKM